MEILSVRVSCDRAHPRLAAITIEEGNMNKKAKKNSKTKGGRLSFRRETIRTLSADESARVLGGRICLPDSCGGRTCPATVCTITVDETM
jgi:hypothetical protein